MNRIRKIHFEVTLSREEENSFENDSPNNDLSTEAVRQFFTNFSREYPKKAQDLYFLNSEQSLLDLERFGDANKAAVSEGQMEEEHGIRNLQDVQI